jgi:hypothetical protein
MFTKTGTFLSGGVGAFQDLVAYDGRIFGLDGLGNDASIVEFGDTPDLDIAVSEAKWKQKRKRGKVKVHMKCNVPCRTTVEVVVRIGKEFLTGTPLKRDHTYTTAKRSFTFRLKRAVRKQVTAARADGQKVRAYVVVYANQLSYYQPVGQFDDSCQTIAPPKPRRKPRTKSFRKCTAAEADEFFG